MFSKKTGRPTPRLHPKSDVTAAGILRDLFKLCQEKRDFSICYADAESILVADEAQDMG